MARVLKVFHFICLLNTEKNCMRGIRGGRGRGTPPPPSGKSQVAIRVSWYGHPWRSNWTHHVQLFPFAHITLMAKKRKKKTSSGPTDGFFWIRAWTGLHIGININHLLIYFVLLFFEKRYIDVVRVVFNPVTSDS